MTLSDDGHWWWDGSKWVPAPPTTAPLQPPLQQQVTTPQVSVQQFSNSPAAFSDPNAWAPEPQSNAQVAPPSAIPSWVSNESKVSATSYLSISAIVIAFILVIGGATGGILWATGYFSSDDNLDDQIIGIWSEEGDSGDALEFKSNGEIGIIENGESLDTNWYGDGAISTTAKWSTKEDTLTLKLTVTVYSGEFNCGDGNLIPASWINDGMEDCDDGSDEGPSVDTSDLSTVVEWVESVFKYEIKDDILYLGLIERSETSENYLGELETDTESSNPSSPCFPDASECYAFVAHNSGDTIENVSPPSWWEEYSYQPTSGTRNSYTASDLSFDATSATDDPLIRITWQHAEDDLNWAFVVMKLTVGDATYDCSTGVDEECSISQDGSDDALWETGEFLTLLENNNDIASSTTDIGIYVTYRGTAVAGTSSVTVN